MFCSIFVYDELRQGPGPDLGPRLNGYGDRTTMGTGQYGDRPLWGPANIGTGHYRDRVSRGL